MRLRKLETTKAAAAKPVVKAETTHEGSLARGGLTPSMRCRHKQIAPQDYVWRSLVCKLKAHFTKQSPYRGAQGRIRRRRADAGGAERDHARGNGAGRYRDIGLGEPAGRYLDPGFLRRADAECRFIRHWRREAESSRSAAPASCRCRHGRARRRSPDRSSPQGAAIPVRQGAFSAITFTPKKMAVISIFTRDIAEHSHACDRGPDPASHRRGHRHRDRLGAARCHRGDDHPAGRLEAPASPPRRQRRPAASPR